MLRIYRMTHATGFVPNLFEKFITLACCKPQIRNIAESDLDNNDNLYIVGLGSKALKKSAEKKGILPKGYGDIENGVIYFMKVAKTIPWKEYYEWCKKESLSRIHISGKPIDKYGDCIYRYDGSASSPFNCYKDIRDKKAREEYIKKFKYIENDYHPEKEKFHNLGGFNVLLGDPRKSYYFGNRAFTFSFDVGKKIQRAAYGVKSYDKVIEEGLIRQIEFESMKAGIKPIVDMSETELLRLLIPEGGNDNE